MAGNKNSGSWAMKPFRDALKMELLKAGDNHKALRRIENGEYGYCDSCGVEISLKRLEARPTATLCIDCKTLEELREKQVAK